MELVLVHNDGDVLDMEQVKIHLVQDYKLLKLYSLLGKLLA